MHKYHFVSKAVAPKRVSACDLNYIPKWTVTWLWHELVGTHMFCSCVLVTLSLTWICLQSAVIYLYLVTHPPLTCCIQAKLAEAKASLEQTLRLLGQAKARLREVEEGIVTLQAKYEETVAKKEELAQKCNLCSARLERAEKVSKETYRVIWWKSAWILHIEWSMSMRKRSSKFYSVPLKWR